MEKVQVQVLEKSDGLQADLFILLHNNIQWCGSLSNMEAIQLGYAFSFLKNINRL